MSFKINISEKSGKTYKIETESEELTGKELHDKIQGKDIHQNLSGYEFEITGASDKAGFPSLENSPGIGFTRLLLGYGKGMHIRPRKEGKKKRSNMKPKGLRLRKTVRGRVISSDIIQINLKVLKEGSKPLSEIFPEQNLPKEKTNVKTSSDATTLEHGKATQKIEPKNELKKEENTKKEEIEVEASA